MKAAGAVRTWRVSAEVDGAVQQRHGFSEMPLRRWYPATRAEFYPPLSFSSAGHSLHDMNPLLELVMGPLLAVHQWLYEHSDGRIGASLGGRPMLLLRTVGRRSKQPRTAALLYVREGDAYVVVASKGGAPQHPGWFHNLTAQPDVEIQVGRERIPVRARVAEGEERSGLWARADEINQGQYAVYQSRTNRVIPVVVLERRTSRGSRRTSASGAAASAPR